jgi:hypothetical protein
MPDGSLARLQTDYINLYQFHWPSRNLPIFCVNSFNPQAERAHAAIDETPAGLGERGATLAGWWPRRSPGRTPGAAGGWHVALFLCSP